MTISPRFKEELKNRLSLSDAIGRKIRLQRAGREFKGCCPFHHEKTPSFYVNDDKQFYHCFGCGAHGDVIGFTMQYENLSYIEAMEQLAAQAGLQIPQSSPQDIQKAKEEKDLHALLEEATRWMEQQLRAPANASAYGYVRDRGMSEEELHRFRIGYAPADRQALRKAMVALGYRDAQMIEAGLLRSGKEGAEPYAFFRERIMFPVTDKRGRVVAFGGRILPDHLRPPDSGDYKPAKYMNSSDTPLFDKGRMLYGESRARRAAAEGQSVIVVEGYVDVMACVKAGFEGAVAPLGTALTEDQIILLWKMIPQDQKVPVLCFDGDSAGQMAARRAMGRILPLLKAGQSAKFAFMPEGQDPDSLVQTSGAKALSAVIGSALSLVDFLWAAYFNGQDFSTPEARASLNHRLEEDILKIPDRDLQYYYRQVIREKIRNAFGGYQIKRNGAMKGGLAAPVLPIKNPAFMQEEMKLLAALLNHPAIYGDFEEEIGLLELKAPRFDAVRQEIIAILCENPEKSEDFLQKSLHDAGYSQELSLILSQNTYALARFARPGAAYEDVCEGWRGVFNALMANKEKRQRG